MHRWVHMLYPVFFCFYCNLQKQDLQKPTPIRPPCWMIQVWLDRIPWQGPPEETAPTQRPTRTCTLPRADLVHQRHAFFWLVLAEGGHVLQFICLEGFCFLLSKLHKVVCARGGPLPVYSFSYSDIHSTVELRSSNWLCELLRWSTRGPYLRMDPQSSKSRAIFTFQITMHYTYGSICHPHRLLAPQG